jgi:hypothetical protein
MFADYEDVNADCEYLESRYHVCDDAVTPTLGCQTEDVRRDVTVECEYLESHYHLCDDVMDYQYSSTNQMA